jgi:anti-sigma B factor antagonist
MDYALESYLDEESNCWLVKLSGEIDIFNSNDMKSKMLALFKERPLDIKINCSELEFIDSTTLGCLVSIHKNVKSNNHSVHLIDLRPNLQKLFKITNLDKVFKIEGDFHEK